jgi:hypothetical protein
MHDVRRNHQQINGLMQFTRGELVTARVVGTSCMTSAVTINKSMD